MFSRKQLTRSIVINVLKAVLAVIIAVIVIVIISGQIVKTSNALLSQKKQALILESRTSMIQDIRASLSSIGANQERLNHALPVDDNISDFLSAMATIASQNSMQQSIQVATPVAANIQGAPITLSEIDYTLKLNGNVSNFVAYLKSLETLPYLTSVNSVSAGAPPDQGWDGSTSFTVQAKLYARAANQ